MQDEPQGQDLGAHLDGEDDHENRLQLFLKNKDIKTLYKIDHIVNNIPKMNSKAS